MKKIISGFVATAFMLVCLTGCGKGADLKCTGKMDGADATITATLDSDKITKVVMVNKSEAESEEEAKQGVAYINAMGIGSSEKGITMSAKASGKKVTLTVTVDVTKMSAEDIENQFDVTDLTKENFVKSMEEQGLTCK